MNQQGGRRKREIDGRCGLTLPYANGLNHDKTPIVRCKYASLRMAMYMIR